MRLLLLTLIFGLVATNAPARGYHVELQERMSQQNSNAMLEQLGTARPWTWQQSSCVDCEFILYPKTWMMRQPFILQFMQALHDEKQNLIRIYKSDPQEYNLLAQMAVGILGRETQFASSELYYLKESVPWVITAMKYADALRRWAPVEENSRGATRIKLMPDKISEEYGLTTADLNDPRNAAIATMGYLILAMKETKKKIHDGRWGFITPATYADYIPYIYFGARNMLDNKGKGITDPDRIAIPSTRIYIVDMQRYMGELQGFEAPRGTQFKYPELELILPGRD